MFMLSDMKTSVPENPAMFLLEATSGLEVFVKSPKSNVLNVPNGTCFL